MARLSVVVNTLNEEANLADCLNSVKGLADEIVVVDMHSDDRTVEIAEKFGAKVYQHKRVGYVEPARNFAFSKATGDWILVLDADERVAEGLKAKIQQVLSRPEAEVYYIPRKNLLMGRWIQNGLWWPDYQLRLWRRGAIDWPTQIHGIPQPKGPSVQLSADSDAAILHYAYNTISEYMEMVNTYTGFEVETLHDAGYRFRRRHVVVSTVREFWRRYFGAGGYKDGFDGLVLAFLLMVYKGVTIVKYWEKYGQRDFHDKGQSRIKTVTRIMLDK